MIKHQEEEEVEEEKEGEEERKKDRKKEERKKKIRSLYNKLSYSDSLFSDHVPTHNQLCRFQRFCVGPEVITQLAC